MPECNRIKKFRFAVIFFTLLLMLLPGAPLGAAAELEIPAGEVTRLKHFPWEFYWKRLIPPADFQNSKPVPDLVLSPVTIWNKLDLGGKVPGSFGYATYRLKVRLQKTGERMALRFAAPLSSYRIYLNGEQVAEAGQPGTSAETFAPRRKSARIFFTPAQRDLEIVVHVANFMLYKGGLRGDIELGPAPVMEIFALRYLAIDVFCVGLIFAIMLYHLSIFLLVRGELSTLIFAVLSLTYFTMALSFGENAINLFLPDLPLALQTRIESACSYLLPPLVLEFTLRLYPHRALSAARPYYAILAVVFSLLLVLPPVYKSHYNVYYYGLVGGSAGLLCMFGALSAVRQRQPGARLLASGLAFLIALTVYAIYLFMAHQIAGSFLSIGFAIFALFQSGSLAHSHAALERKNAEMHARLDRSRRALEDQRRQLEYNLHDSLGGNLTDIKLGIESLVPKLRSKPLRQSLLEIDHRVTGTISSLRTQLLFLEDLQLAVDDFVAGINLILLRRYQMAEREVEILISPETRAGSHSLRETGTLDEENIPELCLMVQELCTNSLKYSVGPVKWQIGIDDKGLRMVVSARSRHLVRSDGRGRTTLRERAQRLSLKFTEEAGKLYSATIELPVKK